MANEVAKKPVELDGFDTFEDRVEGADEQVSNRVIQGQLLKFSNEATWLVGEDELPANLELVAFDIARVVNKWPVDDGPPLSKILGPGEKFPDIDKLNAETPKTEWREGPNGQPVGPWQQQYVLYLLDPLTMGKFSYATSTIGGGIAVRDLRDRITWMRRLRGNHVYPVVTLADVFMRTRFGGRQRPNFVIKRWVTFGDGGGDAAALPAPTNIDPNPESEPVPKTMQEKLDAFAGHEPGKDASGLRTVEEPTASEVVQDSIPW